MLPARRALYAALMGVSYPPALALALGRAIFQRVAKGTPDAILPSGSINAVSPGGGYAGQMYFAKRLDVNRLTDALHSLAADAGIAADQTAIVLAGAPKGSCEGVLDAASIVDGPAGEGSTWLGGWGDDEALKGKVIGLRVFNADEGTACDDGTPVAALQFNLPGMAWDGSACFNFMKEMIHRYCGGVPNDVFASESIRLSQAAAARFRGGPGAFAAYLARLPLAVLANTHSYIWEAACTAPAVFGGPGLGIEMALINLTPDESTKLAAGLKAAGASPFAGLTHAAVSGYRQVVGRNPNGIVQQASLVTAAFEPIVPERNLVGDWLIGPYQRVLPNEDYSLEAAERGYRMLRTELASHDGAVRRAFEAKAYGVLNGGAAAFEAPPTYGDANTLMNSVFFNNYGTRTVHAGAECIGWNWGAPFGLGCNCIYVNGRTCICFATSVLGREKLALIRDHAYQVLRGYMEEPGA